MNIVITPKPLSGRVVIPPSKSISHRTLICAALSKGESEITGVLECEDIDATTDALTALGAEIRTENGVTYVRGIENVPSYAEINCRESGSTLRFMMPVCAALGVETVFTGSGKLPTRPVTPYLDQFPKHGVEFISDTFPYHIKGKLTSGVYPVTGDISSQFITGLMFAMPLLEGASVIQLTSTLQSKPYADITVNCMRAFGIETLEVNGNYNIKGIQTYNPTKFTVEGDCSQAAFFAVANELGSSIELVGVNRNSVQGDRAVFDIIDKAIKINGNYSRLRHRRFGYPGPGSRADGARRLRRGDFPYTGLQAPAHKGERPPGIHLDSAQLTGRRCKDSKRRTGDKRREGAFRRRMLKLQRPPYRNVAGGGFPAVHFPADDNRGGVRCKELSHFLRGFPGAWR